MPNRHYSNTIAYRYGFNGKENDDETGTIDFGERAYNALIGRLLSIDPLTKSYPELTPYQYAENSPIANIDALGLQASPAIAPIETEPVLRVVWRNPSSPVIRNPHNMPEWEFDANGHLQIAQKPETKPLFLPTKTYTQEELGMNIKLTAEKMRAAIKSGKFSFDQGKREDKASAFESRMKDRKTGNYAEVYELRAKQPGYYICYSCEQTIDDGKIYKTNSFGQKEIYLNEGEVWKVGKTNLNGKERYQPGMYESINFNKVTVNEGEEHLMLIDEKKRIVTYPYNSENQTRATKSKNGTIIPRQPGNKIDK